MNVWDWPPIIVGAVVILNLWTWRRRAARIQPIAETVSILIPARNEAENIASLLESLRESTSPAVQEICVYDDLSTDLTAERVRWAAARDSRIRLISGDELPVGWVGKSRALQRLGEESVGDVLLFLDADIQVKPGFDLQAASLMFETDSSVLTAVPEQKMITLGEKLMLPLLHLTYLSWLWLPAIRIFKDPRVLAANGQFLMVRRSTWNALGGFQSIRSEWVDDMAFCRLAKRAGHPVVFVDGFEWAECRMYRGFQSAWRGFSKNVYAGAGSATVLWISIGLFVSVYLLPLVWGSWRSWLALIVIRVLIAVRFRQPWITIPLHPFSILCFGGLALNSYRWALLGITEWKGRRYAVR